MECVSIHSGQTGIQWGLSCWDLFSAEHNLTSGGKINPGNHIFNTTSLCDFSPFYRDLDEDVFKPRALFVDSDNSVIDDTNYGPKIRQIEANQKAFGTEHCASIFGQGIGQKGHAVLGKSLEGVRRLLEECESPQGFMWYHSLGGGTGSGFTTLLARELSREYPELKMHEFSLLPGAELTCARTDVYNSVLGLQNSLELMGCSFLFDSDVLYKTCFNKLHINDPNHFVLNTILARIVSDVTSTLRFPSIVNATLEDLEFNLLPVQRMPFPLVCLQPLLHKNAECADEHFKDIIMSCFEKGNQILNCSPKDDKIIRSCLVLRGLIDMEEVTQGLNALKKANEFKFVTSFTRAHTTCLMNTKLVDFIENIVSVPRIQVCALTNSVAISHLFKELARKFDMMFQQKAFLHWYYSEGMEEDDFINAREDIESLLMNYEHIGK